MGGTIPPRLLIWCQARRTCSCTQPLPFPLLVRPLSFLLSNSSFCFEANLEPFLPPSVAMAPTKKGSGKGPMPSPRSLPPPAPAMDRSIIVNREGLGKVSSALATIFNECRRTTAWPASHYSVDRIATEVQYFADALWSGLVPPFFDFFNVVLSHY